MIESTDNDVLLPARWADLHRRGDHNWLKALMRGLLEISLYDAHGSARAQPARRVKKHEAQRRAIANERQRSAIAWIFDDADDAVFAFVNVCEMLGIDGVALRARVRRQLEKSKVSRHEFLRDCAGAPPQLNSRWLTTTEPK